MSAKLLKKRDAFKNIVLRTLKFTTDIGDDVSQRELMVKLDLLEKTFQACFDIHVEILELTGSEEEAFQETEFEGIQTAFERGKSRLLDTIDSLNADSPESRDPSQSPATQLQAPSRTEIKLPLLKIAPFSGDYNGWKTFRDLFTSAIGDRRDLTGSQKIQYLKSFLDGEAAQLVRPYSVCDGNYRIAWAALDERYDNKRLLVNAHFKRLFEQPEVSSDSAAKLRQLIDTTTECIAALRAHDLPTDMWDAVIVYIVTQRLDAESHKQWELSLGENELPTFAELVRFMEKRCRSLEAIFGASGGRTSEARRSSASGSRTAQAARTTTHYGNANPFGQRDPCGVCEENHAITQCQKFQAMSVNERRSVVKGRRLCFVCMKRGHISVDCSQDMCTQCSGRHHEMLHINTAAAVVAASNAVQSTFVGGYHTSQVLLATAVVHINNSTEKIRVLLDQGSSASLIRESCVQRLGLRRRRTSVPIYGIGGTEAGLAKSVVNISVRSCVDESLAFDVVALVIPTLTARLPSQRLSISPQATFVGLQLADPNFYEPGDIDLIIGADVYGLMLLDGTIKGVVEPGQERPTAENTALGWILTGPMATKGAPDSTVQVSHATASFLDTQLESDWDLRRFWQVEEVGRADLQTDDDRACETHFLETHTRDDTGRFIVQLPFKCSPESALGESRNAAERRLRHMERRLSEKPDLQEQYRAFMKEYAELGHMRVATRPPLGAVYYLPHHCVVKETSSTTRLRVVFDASCKTTSGRSLNDIQHIGPRLQDDLATLVMRFRRHAVALTADITKMYRQVNVSGADMDLQRILWRDEPTAAIQEWQMTTVTYGMAASPFLAVCALQELAKEEQQYFARAAQVVLSDFYVDDLITGCDNSQDAMDLQKELNTLLTRGGFELRKWSTNCATTLSAIPEAIRGAPGPLHLSEDTAVKTLGLLWFPANDHFGFKVTPPTHAERITKRGILSVVARLFDPLGFLSPTIILAKMLIQHLWTMGIAWDEEVPEPTRSRWCNYQTTLTDLEHLRFPRWIGARQGANVQLHCFADASEAAYGGVIYVRCVMPDGTVRITLLTAKTKVAPLKQITLPRLELCAASLLACLLKGVMATFDLNSASCFMWSDSQVALAWIRKAPRSWKTFVANRVAHIQSITPPERWRHVRSADNPADCLSRGVLPGDLCNHPLWFTGPSWLIEDEAAWPQFERGVGTNIDERTSVATVLTVLSNEGDEMIQRYSSITRLQRITAIIIRFMRNCRVPVRERQTGFLTVAELHGALMHWVQYVQRRAFADEIKSIIRDVALSQSSKLLTLNPFIDADGVLRVGGRLRHAAISTSAAHPAILPGDHHLTNLLIDRTHRSLMHGGVQLMLNYIRQRFWIIGAKVRLRQHLHGCVICFRQRPRCGAQQMGDLPEVRVTASRTFSRSGVDYAGPLAYKSRAGRGFRTEKGYVALFVCLCTKAVHLEFVSDLTASAFISAFRRFVSRRGKCIELLSDNATNFIGARRELGDIIHSRTRDDEVARVLADDGTVWRTIPPRSPHFGGLWEAGIKSGKYHLKRIVGAQLLTFEEFATTLAEIEAILNSRPLCALSDDPDDLNALTPGHFLIGCAPTIVPEFDLSETPTNRLSRWQLVSQITQHFWRRWHQEYLNTMQQRYKWTTPTDNVKVGQMAILKDELLPPAKWRLARVIGTRPGEDGRVRVVVLKHSTGETTRAVTRICVLPINSDT